MTAARAALVAALGLAGLVAGCGGGGDEVGGVVVAGTVGATVETKPVPNRGDAADDPAIFVNGANPADSLVIGTDKKGGLAVYDLTGAEVRYLDVGPMNNVDLREGFTLGGSEITLVAASDREHEAIVLFRLDPSTRDLVDVAARPLELDISAYGLCMYRSPEGVYYVFVNSEQGEVQQWELFEADGRVDGRLVRSFDVGSQTEGCAVDDELGRLYIGEESEGVWRYGAEPDSGEARRAVDTTGELGHLDADVEGIAIVVGPGGSGYLIVSSQGSDSYAVYRREGDNQFLGTFEIVDAGGIDAVQETDGLDATGVSLGPAFPRGLLVVQDGEQDDEHQNFKLVPLDAVIRPSS